VSPEQVVARLGRYDAATIRKAEADGRKNMSRPLWRALVKLYPEWAREKGVTLDPIPLFPDAPGATETPDQVAAALLIQAAALDRHTDAITALALRLESLAGDAIREGVADALREAGLDQDDEGLPHEQLPEPLGESPHQ
jgi:hypothetical protein